MNENAKDTNWISVRNLGIGTVLILTILGIGLLWLIFGRNSQQQLMPPLPSPTPVTQTPKQEPMTKSFTELNDDPLAYLNQSLLVTGEFLPLDKANCKRVVGPDVRWSLTAENLQLDVVGFERVVRLLSPGTTLTVQGIWRFYQGSLGCGKAPPDGSMWYLEVKKIVQPNPLIAESGQTIQVEIRPNQPEIPTIISTLQPENVEPVPTQTATITTSLGTTSPTPTLTDQIIPTQTPLLPEMTPSATAPPSVTNTPPTSTPDLNATAPVSTATSTLIPTETPTNNNPTMTSEAPPAVATATQGTGGGYPGPDGSATPTPTATIDPYP